MKLLAFFFLLFALLTFSSCGENDEPNDDIPSGAFRYTGSYQGTTVVDGWILFTNTTLESVRGNWHLEQAVANPPVNLGPQIGNGTFTGAMTNDGVLALNLNPGNADNNVGLAGQFQGEPFNSTLTGQWVYVGFAGVISRGDFVARR